MRHEDAEHFLECGRSALLSGRVDDGEATANNRTVAFVVGTDEPGVVDDLRDVLKDGEEIVWWDSAQDDGTGRSNGTEPGDEVIRDWPHTKASHGLTSRPRGAPKINAFDSRFSGRNKTPGSSEGKGRKKITWC